VYVCAYEHRDGYLLDEGKPQDIMIKYSKLTLRDVFLALCLHADAQEKEEDKRVTHSSTFASTHKESITLRIQQKA